MNLETIQSMWEKDSVIDPDELHTASLVVPTLHAKYYQLFNDLRLLRAKAKKTYQKIYQERYLYYSGKAEPEVYEKEPFPYRSFARPFHIAPFPTSLAQRTLASRRV